MLGLRRCALGCVVETVFLGCTRLRTGTNCSVYCVCSSIVLSMTLIAVMKMMVIRMMMLMRMIITHGHDDGDDDGFLTVKVMSRMMVDIN